MTRSVLTTTLFLAGFFTVAFVVSGCTSDTAVEPQQTAPTSETQPEIPEEMSGIAKLSAADQTIALEQKTCPVSDKPLGSMDAPVKVAVDGQEVFVCCESCVDTVKENPDEYLAKLTQE